MRSTGVRFDGEFAGMLWFADSMEGELSYGAGTVELNHEKCRHRAAGGAMSERSPRGIRTGRRLSGLLNHEKRRFRA